MNKKVMEFIFIICTIFFRVNRPKGAPIVVSTLDGNFYQQFSSSLKSWSDIHFYTSLETDWMTSIEVFSDQILRFELKSLLKFLSKWKPQ